jgi:hypothetical protein
VLFLVAFGVTMAAHFVWHSLLDQKLFSAALFGILVSTTMRLIWYAVLLVGVSDTSLIPRIWNRVFSRLAWLSITFVLACFSYAWANAVHSTFYTETATVFQKVTRFVLIGILVVMTLYTVAALVLSYMLPDVTDASFVVFPSIHIIICGLLLAYFVIALLHVRKVEDLKHNTMMTAMKLLLVSAGILVGSSVMRLATLCVEEFAGPLTSSTLFACAYVVPETLSLVVLLFMLYRYFSALGPSSHKKQVHSRYVPLHSEGSEDEAHIPKQYRI